MPPDYTDIENDDTYWKNVESDWYWWREGWEWIQYVGAKNQNFLISLGEV